MLCLVTLLKGLIVNISSLASLLLPGVPPVPKKRGRPPTGCAMSAAERKRNQRERMGLVTLSVDLPADLVDALSEYMRFKEMTKGEVIEKLLRSQLLRKR